MEQGHVTDLLYSTPKGEGWSGETTSIRDVKQASEFVAATDPQMGFLRNSVWPIAHAELIKVVPLPTSGCEM